MNVLELIGIITRPPVVKETQFGNVLNFNICQETKKKNKAGETKIEKMYIDCEAWGEVAAKGKDMLAGQEVYVGGMLKYSSWDHKEFPIKIYKHSLVVKSLIFDKSLAQTLNPQADAPILHEEDYL